MIVFLYRPSPQIPNPSVRAASLCYDASAYNIRSQNQQMDNASFDITWIFLQTLFMAINTILWTMSYPEVRAVHPKEELEEHINIGISIVDRCTDRWPGSLAAANLYRKLSDACLRSYSHSERASSSSLSASSPASALDAPSPASEVSSTTATSQVFSLKAPDAPTFGHVFNEAPDNFAANAYHKNLSVAQPAFRTGSIFVTPARTQTDRRFSYFPPEFPPQMPNSWNNIPPLPQHMQPLQPPNIPPQPRARSGPATIRFTEQPVVQPQAAPIFTTNQFQDPSLFMQAPILNFGPHLYEDQNFAQTGRTDSLSLEQQQELLQSLETQGMDWIDSNLGLMIPQKQHFYGAEG